MNANLITYIIIGITAFVSWQAWQKPMLFERLKFQMNRILQGKEYDRMFTSAFVHADTMHLIFNMYALLIFMPLVLSLFSPLGATLLYIAAIYGGSLLTILFHKKESWYSAVGASGGVSGIVFSAIIIQPDLELTLIFLPFFSFPGWVFGLIYLGYSLFGMKRNIGNLGHAAHLGGSAVGIIGTIIVYPYLLQTHAFYLLLMLIPIVIMGVLAFRNNR